MQTNSQSLLPQDSLLPLPAIARQVSLDASLRQAFEALVAQYPPWRAFTAAEVYTAIRFLESGSCLACASTPSPFAYGGWDEKAAQPVRAFIHHPALPTVAVVRLLMLAGYTGPNPIPHPR
jgi:hypothetical protein